MERIELNLDNPIFVVYFDGDKTPTGQIVEMVEKFKKTIDIYSNVTFWYIISNRTAIECVYDGFSRNRQTEIRDLIKQINTRIDIISKSNSFDDFKINIRDWRINELVNGTQEK